MNNTDRFTGKARAYAQGRPDYPASVVGLLTRESRRENPRLADMGSGTGILSRAMLERGCTVYSVEPNDDMRKEVEKRLSAFPRFHSVAGTAERTGLPGASVDLVTAAQSFHWFDAAAFKRECRRILSGGGKVALIWNSRVEDSPIAREEGNIHRLYCPCFYGFSGGLADRATVANMAPEYGATMGFFPMDERCSDYLRRFSCWRGIFPPPALMNREPECGRAAACWFCCGLIFSGARPIGWRRACLLPLVLWLPCLGWEHVPC